MEEANLTRSMSKKGCSSDNSACEGFFGHLKTEMFYGHDWDEYSIEEFIQEINRYMGWYCKAKHETGIYYSAEITCEGSIWKKDDTKCENLRCKAVSYKIAAGRWEKL